MAFIFFICFHFHADAHKVSIFAWIAGDTVYTQSKFGGGKKVKGGQVIVFGPEGNQVLEGKTDENGDFSFKIPRGTGLKMVLKTLRGHMAHMEYSRRRKEQLKPYD